MKPVFNALASYIKKTDRIIWLCCFVLSGLSLVLLSGILGTDYRALLDIGDRNLFVQTVSVVLGTIGAVVLSFIGYRDIVKLRKLHMPLSYGLLLLTFFIGVGAPGRPDDKRWLRVPGINFLFQPAEFLRLSFIVVFAYHIFTVKEKINEPKYLGGLLLHAVLPVILHFQGDDGSALIFLVIMACMLFAAGIDRKYILSAVGLLGVSLPLIWNVILNDFQKQRILSVYSPTLTDTRGIIYQQYRAKLAFGSGGLRGKGIFGAHTYVPEMHNDFIFSFLGESLGFLGVAFVVAVFILLWMRILACSKKSDDLLGRLICVGVFAMFAFQTAINIGMNLSLLPVIGNTLPFLSYGGSSMLTSFLCVGLVLSVSMHSSDSLFY